MWITRAARLAAPLLILLATATPAAADPPYGTDPVHGNSSAQGSSIVDIRIDGKPESGFDRVTFEFGDSLGGYDVAYVDEVTQVESGDAVALEGSAFVQVTLTGIPNSQTAPQDTRTERLTTLIQVVGAGVSSDGTVRFGLGATGKTGFNAFTLGGPNRLVVDLAHPGGTPATTTSATQPSAGGADEASPEPATPAPTTGDVSAASDSSFSLPAYVLLVGLVCAGLGAWIFMKFSRFFARLHRGKR